MSTDDLDHLVISIHSCTVLGGEKTAQGLLVDSTDEIVEIASRDIEESPQFGKETLREFISGMSKMTANLIAVLEPGTTLSRSEMALIANKAMADSLFVKHRIKEFTWH